MNLRKSTFYNMLFSLLLQVVTMINGLIVPRLILGTFGSNINGLVSSITQFLNYISIIEGGLGSVILAALYKAVAQNDNEKVSSILVATKKFFREIGFIYIGYAVVLSLRTVAKLFEFFKTSNYVCVIPIRFYSFNVNCLIFFIRNFD